MSLFLVSTTIRYRETAWKSLCFEKPLFLDILSDFGHFRWPNLAESGRNCQKAKTFHMSLFPGLYGHLLQRNSLEKPMFRKPAIFGHFGQFRPFSVAESG